MTNMPTPEIIDCEQGSDEWHAARCGIPTASKFSHILAQGAGKMRAKYLRTLAGEVITGEPFEGYKNAAMERGNAMEAEARETYAFTKNVEPRLVGFIRCGNTGCSPDSLIGEDGMLEIKTMQPDLLIDVLEADTAPSEHIAQCQGNLWVAQRKWIDLAIFWPKMPLFVKRIYRDEVFIARLAAEVETFNLDLKRMVEKVRAYKPKG